MNDDNETDMQSIRRSDPLAYFLIRHANTLPLVMLAGVALCAVIAYIFTAK